MKPALDRPSTADLPSAQQGWFSGKRCSRQDRAARAAECPCLETCPRVDLSPTLGIPSAAYGLNDIGSIVGTATLLPDAIPRGYGFLLSHEAGLRNLRLGEDVVALDVNNRDEAVGYLGLGIPPSAMLWSGEDESGPWTGRTIALGVAFAIFEGNAGCRASSSISLWCL